LGRLTRFLNYPQLELSNNLAEEEAPSKSRRKFGLQHINSPAFLKSYNSQI
jgi:hypothetical protein